MWAEKNPVSEVGWRIDVIFGPFHSSDLDLRIGPLFKEDMETWKSPKINFSSHRKIVIFLQEHDIPILY